MQPLIETAPAGSTRDYSAAGPGLTSYQGSPIRLPSPVSAAGFHRSADFPSPPLPNTSACMNLTREQAAAVAKSVGLMLGYLVRLRERMGKVGFLPGDPLYQLVRKAEDALHRLSVELHYRSCGSGTGRPTGDG
jgi:hypothetical protein